MTDSHRPRSVFGPRRRGWYHRPDPGPPPGRPGEPLEQDRPRPVPVERPGQRRGIDDDPGESVRLLARHRAGDQAALQELVERYQDRLRRLVKIKLTGQVRRYAEVSDIVQDVNVTLVRKLGDLEASDRGAILNWLSEVVLNRIRSTASYMNALKREAGRTVPFDVELEEGEVHLVLPAEEHAPLPPELAWKRELREVLDEAMLELPEHYREVILLRDYAGGSWQYVAREIGSPSEAAAEQLHRRAWVKLQAVVRPRLGDLHR